MFITIINDCKDDNARGRSATRTAALFNQGVNFVGVSSDLEAAGNLIDMLDAGNGEEGIILVNVAPRHKEAKKWENGTPFGFFHYKKILVVSSIDGLTLSLVKKLKLIKSIYLLDIPTVLEKLKNEKEINNELFLKIKNTQFRSLEFLPRVAQWIHQGLDIPFEDYALSNIKDAPEDIWWVDNFGNCKTTLFPEDVNFKNGSKVNLKWGEFKCFQMLKDVPDEQKAVIIGSSGLENKRFLEIVIQGQSIANFLNIK